MNSLLQEEKECFICGKTTGLHKHHIYGGANRKKSEENGFWVWLAPEWHNMSGNGVHFDRMLDLMLKRLCQKEYEKGHTREEFMKLIGKSYL